MCEPDSVYAGTVKYRHLYTKAWWKQAMLFCTLWETAPSGACVKRAKPVFCTGDEDLLSIVLTEIYIIFDRSRHDGFFVITLFS